MTRNAPLFAALMAAALLLAGAGNAAAQSCTTIGSSTFCGTRGSHNTVGNTMIFNNGPAGQRLGGYAVTGTPPRTSVIRGAETRPLAAPRGFAGVGTSKQFGGSGEIYEARIAALRAEILALEAEEKQRQLEKLGLTPAQEAAKDNMPPALVRALTLAKQAREEQAREKQAAQSQGDPKPGTN